MFRSLVLLAEELALWTTENCQPFEASFVAHAISFTRYFGVLTTLALFIYGIRYCEIYLLLFSLGSALNGVVNVVLRAVVADGTLVVPTCVDVYEIGGGNWPSFQSQQVAFIVTFVATYTVMYRAHAHFTAVLALMLVFCAVVAADLMLNYHTRSQIVGGVLIGAFIGAVWQVIVRFAVMPYSRRLLATRLARYLEYQDTLCAASLERKLE